MSANEVTEKRAAIIHALSGFSGSEEAHRSSMFARNIFHTDGVKHMASICAAYWLIDAVASHIITSRKVRAERFQVWTLTKRPRRMDKEERLDRESQGLPAPVEWLLKCASKGDDRRIASQVIPYSSFPLDEFKMYVTWSHVEGKPAWILCLPGES